MVWESLHLAPMIPWWLIYTFAGMGLVLVALGASQRARGMGLRAALVGTILLVLANPQLIGRETDPIPDKVAIIVDDSASQRLAGRAEQAEAALLALTEALDQRGDIDYRVSRVSDNGEAETETRLFGAIAGVIGETPAAEVAAIIVITDGLANDTADAVGLGVPGAPLQVLMTGERTMPDRRLVLEKAPEFALVERNVGLVVRVADLNVPGNPDMARVIVRQDGRIVFDQMIETNRPFPIMIAAERRGRMVVEVEAIAFEGEAFTVNNSTVLEIDAVRDRLRVLMVSGEPHQGERIWRSALLSDPAVDLIHFTILRLPTSFDLTSAQELALIPFPTRELFENQLDRFDLIIFDRYRLMGVLPMFYMQVLADYVDNGGALLISSGPEFATPFNLFNTPLSAVLPVAPTGRVIEQGFRPKVSFTGQRHPVTSTLASTGETPEWGRWFRAVQGIALAGDTVLEGPENVPLLQLARMGDGRVAQIMSDQIWLWARGVDGGGPHRELLRRSVHWLMKEPDLEEESLKARGNGLTLEIERHSLSVEGGMVLVTGPDGTSAQVNLTPQGKGVSTALFEVDQPGLYEITDGIRQVFAGAGALNTLETREIVPTSERIKPLADASRGGIFWLEDGMPDLRRVSEGSLAHGAGWLGLWRREAVKVIETRQVPLIPAWLGILMILGTAMLAWWRESR